MIKSVFELIDVMEVDEFVFLVDLCEFVVIMKVDVVLFLLVGDVFKFIEVVEVDVVMLLVVDVFVLIEVQEVILVVFLVVVFEFLKIVDCNVVVVGSDISFKLVSCIYYFCFMLVDLLDVSKGRDFKLILVFLKVVMYVVEKVGIEGIDVQQLINFFECMGKSCFYLLFSGMRVVCEVGLLDVCL